MNQLLTREEINRRYVTAISNYYVHADFTPPRGRVFRTGKWPWGGYHDDALHKGVITDFDGVYNASGKKRVSVSYRLGSTIKDADDNVLPKLFVIHLGDLNRNVGSMVGKLWGTLVEMMRVYGQKLPFWGYIEEFTDRLVAAKLDIYQYNEAAKRAARDLELTPNTLKFLSDMHKLGYIISINSGSPQAALEYVAREKLIHIPNEEVYGSEFVFEDKRLVRVEPRLGKSKVEARDNFCRKHEIDSGLTVTLSDNPIEDGMLGADAGLGLVLWLDSKGISPDSLPGNINVTCPDARYDLALLEPIIRKYEMGRVIAYLRDPRGMEKLFREGETLETLTNRAVHVDESQYQSLQSQFVVTYNQVMELLASTFPYHSTSVKENYQKLLSEPDVGVGRDLIVKIFDEIRKYVPIGRGPRNDELIDQLSELSSELDELVT